MRQLAQILMSIIFIKGGYDAFIQPGGRVDKVAAAGLPNPKTAVQLNGAVMVVGGAMLALDIAPKLAATALISSMIPTTFVGHPFWKETNETARQAQLLQFCKNLGAVGGLVLVITQKEK